MVTLALLSLVAALIIPAINRSRLEARRVQSANNLKHLILGAQCFHDVYKRLPSGATLSDSGEPRHGWFTSLMPYLCSNALYERIDKDLPWDHVQNRYLFIRPFIGETIPGVEPQFTTEGFGTLHYLANPNLLHRGSRVSLDDQPDRAALWIFGEARPPFAPWGYPFNWRELEYPLNIDGHYGAPWDGTQFAFADGSVGRISNDVDRNIIDSMNRVSPNVDAALKQKPTRTFEAGSQPTITTYDVDAKHPSAGYYTVRRTASGSMYIADFVVGDKRGEEPVTTPHGPALDQLATDHPKLRELYTPEYLDAEMMETVRRFTRLEILTVGFVLAPPEQLATLKKLRTLSFSSDDKTEMAIQAALPDCELHRR